MHSSEKKKWNSKNKLDWELIYPSNKKKKRGLSFKGWQIMGKWLGNIQAYLADIAGLILDHYHNKASIAIKWVVIFFAGWGFCLWFVKKKKKCSICEAQ